MERQPASRASGLGHHSCKVASRRTPAVEKEEGQVLLGTRPSDFRRRGEATAA